jgi:hypothetical protein
MLSNGNSGEWYLYLGQQWLLYLASTPNAPIERLWNDRLWREADIHQNIDVASVPTDHIRVEYAANWCGLSEHGWIASVQSDSRIMVV